MKAILSFLIFILLLLEIKTQSRFKIFLRSDEREGGEETTCPDDSHIQYIEEILRQCLENVNTNSLANGNYYIDHCSGPNVDDVVTLKVTYFEDNLCTSAPTTELTQDKSITCVQDTLPYTWTDEEGESQKVFHFIKRHCINETQDKEELLGVNFSNFLIFQVGYGGCGGENLYSVTSGKRNYYFPSTAMEMQKECLTTYSFSTGLQFYRTHDDKVKIFQYDEVGCPKSGLEKSWELGVGDCASFNSDFCPSYICSESHIRILQIHQENITCYDIPLNDSSVCSSTGYCNYKDHCVCDDNAIGDQCEYKTGYYKYFLKADPSNLLKSIEVSEETLISWEEKGDNCVFDADSGNYVKTYCLFNNNTGLLISNGITVIKKHFSSSYCNDGTFLFQTDPIILRNNKTLHECSEETGECYYNIYSLTSLVPQKIQQNHIQGSLFLHKNTSLFHDSTCYANETTNYLEIHHVNKERTECFPFFENNTLFYRMISCDIYGNIRITTYNNSECIQNDVTNFIVIQKTDDCSYSSEFSSSFFGFDYSHSSYFSCDPQEFIYCGDYTNQDASLVCGGYGICTYSNHCDCFDTYTSTDAYTHIFLYQSPQEYLKCVENLEWECNGIKSYDSLVCSSQGSCISPEICNCSAFNDEGKYGTDCEKSVCFGINEDSKSVCNGNGKCQDTDDCNCFDGYEHGELKSCELWRCQNIFMNETDTVCSSHGSCISPDTCFCNSGYYGSNCSSFSCFGIDSKDLDVCGGNTCIAPNVCSCEEGKSGLECQEWNCFGINRNDQNVCGGIGAGAICEAPDFCQCNSTLQEGIAKFNDTCVFSCDGETDPSVACNSNGKCSGFDECTCNSEGFNSSSYCKDCINSQSGTHCNVSLPCLDEFCNDNGVCDGDSCLCSGNFAPPYCSQCNSNYYSWNCSIFCDSNITCNDHGKCDMDSGTCNCFNSKEFGFFTSPNCGICQESYNGSKCNIFKSSEIEWKYTDSFEALRIEGLEIYLSNSYFLNRKRKLDSLKLFDSTTLELLGNSNLYEAFLDESGKLEILFFEKIESSLFDHSLFVDFNYLLFIANENEEQNTEKEMIEIQMHSSQSFPNPESKLTLKNLNIVNETLNIFSLYKSNYSTYSTETEEEEEKYIILDASESYSLENQELEFFFDVHSNTTICDCTNIEQLFSSHNRFSPILFLSKQILFDENKENSCIYEFSVVTKTIFNTTARSDVFKVQIEETTENNKEEEFFVSLDETEIQIFIDERIEVIPNMKKKIWIEEKGIWEWQKLKIEEIENNYDFSWMLTDVQNGGSWKLSKEITTNTRSLTIESFSFASFGKYVFEFEINKKIVGIGDKEIKRVEIDIEVVPRPLVAIIDGFQGFSGGTKQVMIEDDVILDGSLSYDPDTQTKKRENERFVWKCRYKTTVFSCESKIMNFWNSSDSILTIPSFTFEEKEEIIIDFYYFSSLKDDLFSDFVSITLEYRTSNPLSVSISGKNLDTTTKILLFKPISEKEILEPLTFFASIEENNDLFQYSNIEYQWSIKNQEIGDFLTTGSTSNDKEISLLYPSAVNWIAEEIELQVDIIATQTETGQEGFERVNGFSSLFIPIELPQYKIGSCQVTFSSSDSSGELNEENKIQSFQTMISLQALNWNKYDSNIIEKDLEYAFFYEYSGKIEIIQRYGTSNLVENFLFPNLQESSNNEKIKFYCFVKDMNNREHKTEAIGANNEVEFSYEILDEQIEEYGKETIEETINDLMSYSYSSLTHCLSSLKESSFYLTFQSILSLFSITEQLNLLSSLYTDSKTCFLRFSNTNSFDVTQLFSLSFSISSIINQEISDNYSNSSFSYSENELSKIFEFLDLSISSLEKLIELIELYGSFWESSEIEVLLSHQIINLKLLNILDSQNYFLNAQTQFHQKAEKMELIDHKISTLQFSKLEASGEIYQITDQFSLIHTFFSKYKIYKDGLGFGEIGDSTINKNNITFFIPRIQSFKLIGEENFGEIGMYLRVYEENPYKEEKNHEEKGIVVSEVFGFTLFDSTGNEISLKDLEEDEMLNFRFLFELKPEYALVTSEKLGGYLPVCQYYNTSAQKWEENGCFTEYQVLEDGKIVNITCKCNHATEFSIGAKYFEPTNQNPVLLVFIITFIVAVIVFCGILTIVLEILLCFYYEKFRKNRKKRKVLPTPFQDKELEKKEIDTEIEEAKTETVQESDVPSET